ncbi:hypothetical protein J4Q44_G00305280 [Coregonus suidteri]|uniref:Uncharacterized protein n=1 Tax=Coregonus suidteri TaxID=861788 RepID=A0AAN8KVT7_9TELE
MSLSGEHDTDTKTKSVDHGGECCSKYNLKKYASDLTLDPNTANRELSLSEENRKILKKFYSCTIESILTGCITAWYGNCSASDRKALQRVVRMAQDITGAKLPAIQDLYTRRV